MTQAKLDRLCVVWKRRLRLQDGHVWVILTYEPDPDKFGRAEKDPLNTRADIEVHNNADAEETLVHELLHLRLLPFGVDATDARQAAMNLLANSFVRAYAARKGQRNGKAN